MSISRLGRVTLVAASALATVLVAGACGSSTQVSVSDPWARTSAGDQTTGAAYMVISGGDEPDRLIGAAVPSSIAAKTEIHETVESDGSSDGMGDMEQMGGMDGEAMTMRPVDGIDIPAGETVRLEPGGYHIMLIDLAKPLTSGDTFELTLTFEKAGEQVVTVSVRDA